MSKEYIGSLTKIFTGKSDSGRIDFLIQKESIAQRVSHMDVSGTPFIAASSVISYCKRYGGELYSDLIDLL